jgi:hypothetical protein
VKGKEEGREGIGERTEGERRQEGEVHLSYPFLSPFLF